MVAEDLHPLVIAAVAAVVVVTVVVVEAEEGVGAVEVVVGDLGLHAIQIIEVCCCFYTITFLCLSA